MIAESVITQQLDLLQQAPEMVQNPTTGSIFLPGCNNLKYKFIEPALQLETLFMLTAVHGILDIFNCQLFLILTNTHQGRFSTIASHVRWSLRATIQRTSQARPRAPVPQLINKCTTSKCSFSFAALTGVAPSKRISSWSAPNCNNRRTASKWPP